MTVDDEAAQMRYAQALSDWAEVHGYEAETLWDMCTMAALGVPYEKAQWRQVRTLSGGEQKRLVLEALLRGPDEVLLLDEPDNYLDVPGKRWLEERLKETRKTVLFVSHDRELLVPRRREDRQRRAEPGRLRRLGARRRLRHLPRGAARAVRALRGAARRWDEEHAQLKELVLTLRQQAAISPDMASRYRAVQTRLRSSRRPGRRRSRRASRTSGCGCRAGGPGCGP